MFKVSKKVEYGLIAIKHITKAGMINPISAKVISQKYKIPYDLLSKILQQLKREKILASVQGINGGYKLSRDPDKINLASVFNAIEGSNFILDCGTHKNPNTCKIYKTCIISGPMQKVQKSITNYFHTTSLAEIV
ncbi:MAG: Rrf2 family transcriptional regulator [Ignavibacteriae bacterium]|nr:MAG: Rrf2 family transcriptional regulator [Ignavibacteriota bacterium]